MHRPAQRQQSALSSDTSMSLSADNSLGGVMRASRGHTTGFDYLRIGLSLAVVLVHCIAISRHDGRALLWETHFSPVLVGVLPAFFALSGFLVTGSILRNSVPQFIALRLLRIIPALAVEIFLSALVLGTIFTALPLPAYLSDPGFRAYFLNIVGDIHYTLPGVFEGKMLNAQLWTIPAELECYILLVVSFVLGLVSRPKLFLAVAIVGTIIMSYMALRYSLVKPANNLPGRVLVCSFAFGCLLFLFKDRVPYNRAACLGCIGVSYVAFFFPNLAYLGSAPIAYVTIYVGLMRLPKLRFGDLSYGVYLFHFPVARTLWELAGSRLEWWGLLPATILITTGFAALSWRFVEKPILDRKNVTLAAIARTEARISPLMPWRRAARHS